MGYGEVTGNQSVYWHIAHEDDNGTPKKLKAQPGTGFPDCSEDDRINVGRGAWGRDPQPLKSVGRKKRHSGRFRVSLRFTSREQAEAARDAIKVARLRGGGYALVVDVPANPREHPEDPPPPEVRVDW